MSTKNLNPQMSCVHSFDLAQTFIAPGTSQGRGDAARRYQDRNAARPPWGVLAPYNAGLFQPDH